MMYVVPVQPWFRVPFSETGRRLLGLVLVMLCLLGLVLSAAHFMMLADIARAMLSLRYFYPPSEHFFRPVLLTLLHVAIRAGVLAWFAVACFYTSRWQTRTRFNEYISLMVFGFLAMSLCEHPVFVALYDGVRGWTDTLGRRVDRASFFYKFNDLARFNVDRLQEAHRCCGGSADWMWHLIDWVGLRDETFLPQRVQRQLRGMPWQMYAPTDQVNFVRSLSEYQLAEMRNRSMALCRDCPFIKPWSCCRDDSSAHVCQVPVARLTWLVYSDAEKHTVSCQMAVYVDEFYDTMLDWGAVAELMSWLDLVIALLAKYLDSASNEAMLSGFPDGPSQGYLMQRCCGWFCPKPGFMPERLPPAAVTYRPEEAPSGIFGAEPSGLEHQLDEQLDREIEQKKQNREDRRQELRQAKIDKKIAKHRRNMGLTDTEDDASMDAGVDDEADVVEANDDWGAD